MLLLATLKIHKVFIISLQFKFCLAESRRDWMLKRFEFAAKKHVRNSNYQIWTHENHPVELYSKPFIEQKLKSIHQNPVRAGIVLKPEDYIYSSASN